MSDVPSTQRSKRIHVSCRSDMRAAGSGRHPFFVGLSAILLLLLATSSHAVTRYVEKWGAPGPCTKADPCASIQYAINLSVKNDRIIVGPGRYNESLVVYADRTGLKLESTAGRHATIINANGGDNTLEIQAEKVRVGSKGKGFTFLGATGSMNAGILVDVAGDFPAIRIEGNRFGKPRRPGETFVGNVVGLRVSDGGGKMQVRNNIFVNNQQHGIHCSDCPRALVRENRFESNGEGILMAGSDAVSANRNMATANGDDGYRYDSDSEQMKHFDNVAEFNGVHGLEVFDVDGGRAEANIATENGATGVSVVQTAFDRGDARISRNLAVNNANWGIRLAGTEAARVDSNTVVDNGLDGIYLLSITGLSSLKNNSAMDNTQCSIDGNTGVFINFRMFAAANGDDAPCGDSDFTLTGPVPSKPGPLKVNTAAKVVGG